MVCRMMGYTGSTEPNKNAHYGNGSDTIWLNNLQCTGNEDSLFNCVHDGLRNNSCPGSNKAVVSCVGPDGNIAYFY